MTTGRLIDETKNTASWSPSFPRGGGGGRLGDAPSNCPALIILAHINYKHILRWLLVYISRTPFYFVRDSFLTLVNAHWCFFLVDVLFVSLIIIICFISLEFVKKVICKCDHYLAITSIEPPLYKCPRMKFIEQCKKQKFKDLNSYLYLDLGDDLEGHSQGKVTFKDKTSLIISVIERAENCTV